MRPKILRTLTGKTLLRLAVAGSLLLVAAALCTAYLLYRQSEAEAAQRLAAAAAERARVAERVLGYTVETHETVRLAFMERWPAYQEEANCRRLDSFLARYPDGVWRNRPEYADGRVHPTGWVPRGTPLSAELRCLLVLFWDLSRHYGPGAAIRRDNLFFMSVPEQSNVGYDPYLFPNWVFDLPVDFDQRAYEWGRLAYQPARPGERSRYATPMVDDVGPGPQLGPIFQVLTPIHLGPRHVATVASTLLLKDLLARTMPTARGEPRYLLFKADGRLLADTGRADAAAPSAEQATLAGLGGDLPAGLQAAAGKALETPRAGYSPSSDAYHAVARIDGPDWFVAATLPGAAVRADAWRVALWGLGAHLVVLLALLGLLATILRRHVATPLGALTRAAERLAAGDLGVRLPSDRDDELGRMASAFNDMASRVAERDAALRQDKEEIAGALTALRLTEERWRAMTDNASDLVAVVDPAGALRYVSPPVQRMLGRPADGLVGRSLIELADQPSDVEALQRQLEQPDGRPLQFRARHADGRTLVLEAVGNDLRRHPAVRGVVLNIRDVSETVQAEQQLRQAQKLEAIGTLAGGIAHDFNNILAAILGYGEMARNEAAPGSAQHRHIDAAMSAGLRAKSLVERILAFSRSGTGERLPVHVQSVVAEALDAVAGALPPGYRLDRTLQAGDAAVLGDATQVHQVVMNLCANAVQAMKAGGTLNVALEAVQVEDRSVTTRRLPDGRYLRLAVTDTGSGIAPAVLERIFDPFFTTKEIGVGTGLGLSLVHGIVTDLGGGIDVASRVGAGTRFDVYLPVHGVAGRPQPDDGPIDRGNGETVMLVDDEDALVRLGEEMLAELGYEPVGFDSGRAALEAFRAEPERFQAVLSDESMAGMTGAELAVAMRRVRPDLPFVLLSGHVSPALWALAREAGIDEVLPKPPLARDIARSLAAALKRAPPAA